MTPIKDQPTRVQTTLDDELRQRVLRPYKENCRYVHRATVTRPATTTALAAEAPATWLCLEADCGVAASCYIEDTGHFHAVEFNIVYNQMLYLGIAEAVRQRLWPELQHKTLDDFFRHQTAGRVDPRLPRALPAADAVAAVSGLDHVLRAAGQGGP